MKIIIVSILITLSCIAYGMENTDSKIKLIIVHQNLKGFGGECPCPYYKTSDGEICGDESTYSKTEGAEPKCYHYDVTSEEVENYRKFYLK